MAKTSETFSNETKSWLLGCLKTPYRWLFCNVFNFAIGAVWFTLSLSQPTPVGTPQGCWHIGNPCKALTLKQLSQFSWNWISDSMRTHQICYETCMLSSRLWVSVVDNGLVLLYQDSNTHRNDENFIMIEISLSHNQFPSWPIIRKVYFENSRHIALLCVEYQCYAVGEYMSVQRFWSTYLFLILS